MLRVATLSTLFPSAERPGFGLFVARQTLELSRCPEVRVEVVSPRPVRPWSLRRAGSAESWEGLPVHRPAFVSLPGGGNARRLARAARPFVERLEPDVIESEFFWPDGVAALHLSRALGVPFSIKARGSDIGLWGGVAGVREQMLEAAEAAGGLLAVSAALKRDMVALGMPEEKISVHYTGVDSNMFRPRPRAPGRTVLTVGNLVPEKGHDILLAAMRLLPDARLLVAGDGPERARLEAAAGPNVRFLGAVTHADMPALLAEADVMALASEREGLANAWIEALACGTPVVCPDVGGAREVLDRPEAGRIVERTPEAFATGIAAVLADPPPRDAVAASAARFSWSRNACELEAHLRLVSGERH